MSRHFSPAIFSHLTGALWRAFSILALVVLSIGAASPASAAPLQQTPSVPYWICVVFDGSTCPVGEYPYPLISMSATRTNTSAALGTFAKFQIVCPNVTDCQSLGINKIYYEVLATFTPDGEWVNPYYNGAFYHDATSTPIDNTTCGNPCVISLTGSIDMLNTWNPWDIWLAMSTSYSGSGTWSYTVTYSYEEIIVCGDAFIPKSIVANAFDIYPYVEVPQGPDAQLPNLPDHQIVDLYPPLTEGMTWIYQLSIDGGWNDGATDRTDYQYSFDGETWDTIDNLPTLCQDSTGWIFETGELKFYIRVNDTAGNFGNNTPAAPPYPTFTITNMEQVAPLSCGDQFDYDNSDWLASGTLTANSHSAHYPDMEFVVGDWYVIETAGGPWQDNGEPQYDAKASGSNSWSFSSSQTFYIDGETHDHPLVECAETTEDGHYRIYIQADWLTISMFVNDHDANIDNNSGQLGYNIYHAEFNRFPTVCERQFEVNDELYSNTIPSTADQGIGLIGSFVGAARWSEVSNIWEAYDYLNNAWQQVMSGEDPSTQDNYLVQTQWYMFESTGGPWYDENPHVSSYNIEMTKDGTTWVPLSDWPEANCVSELDNLGHVRVYFQFLDGDQDTKFRVRDTNLDFSGNQGEMGFTVTRLTYLRSIPEGSTWEEAACNGTYAINGPATGVYPLDPQEEGGVYLPASLQEGLFYGIETGGYWEEGSDPGWKTLVELSTDNGVTWVPLNESPAVLCGEVFLDNDNHLQQRFYIRPNAGELYKLRSQDADDDWFTNVDHSFAFTVYEALANLDPWNTCAQDYQLFKIQSGVIVYGNQGGAAAQRLNLVPGEFYAIEVVDGPWHENLEPNTARWDYQLSPDDGVTWYVADDTTMPGFECLKSNLPGGGLYSRVYFIAQNSNTYTRIQVNDQDANFANNTNEIVIDIYAAVSSTGAPGDPDISAYVPYSATSGCYSIPQRPQPPAMPAAPSTTLDSITDFTGLANLIWQSLVYSVSVTSSLFTGGISYITGWVGYAFNSVTFFFLWCPEHTAAVKAILNDTRTLEPMATYARLNNFQKQTQAQIVSYQWTYNTSPSIPFSEEGGGTEGFIQEIFPPVGASPFNGGTIEWADLGGGEAGSLTTCNAKLTAKFGPENSISTGFCIVLNALKITSLNVYLNYAIVLVCVILFIRYLKKHFVGEMIGLLTGYNGAAK